MSILVNNKLDFFSREWLKSQFQFQERAFAGSSKDMQVSSKGKYSVRAVLDIAQHSDGAPVPLAAISQREGISLLFLEQLFQPLRKGNIVKSVRGSHGGYVLARDPSEITIGEVVRLIESPIYTSSCFSKEESVDDCRISSSCISGAIWKQLAEHVDNFLDSITIADLANKSKPEIVYGLRVKSKRILERTQTPDNVAEPDTAEVA